MFDTRELAWLKALEEYTIRKDAALKILSLNKPITDFSVNKLKSLVQYRKRKDDGAVPIAKKDLLEMYDLIYLRTDQTLNTYPSSIGHQ